MTQRTPCFASGAAGWGEVDQPQVQDLASGAAVAPALWGRPGGRGVRSGSGAGVIQVRRQRGDDVAVVIHLRSESHGSFGQVFDAQPKHELP